MIFANSTRRKVQNGMIKDPMIVHIIAYILLLSISNCCAAINIHLFIYLFIYEVYYCSNNLSNVAKIWDIFASKL